MPVDLGLARGVQERGSHLSFCLRGNSLAHITRKVALITLDPGALITMLRTGLTSSPLPVSLHVGLILRRICPTWQDPPSPTGSFRLTSTYLGTPEERSFSLRVPENPWVVPPGLVLAARGAGWPDWSGPGHMPSKGVESALLPPTIEWKVGGGGSRWKIRVL